MIHNYIVFRVLLQVDCGSSHSVMLTEGGAVYTWTDSQTNAANQLAAVSIKDVVYIAANSGYTLALSVDGSVHSWGSNNCGQVSV